MPIDPVRHQPLFNPRVPAASRRQPHYVAHCDGLRAEALERLADNVGMRTDLDESPYSEYALTLLGCTVPIRDDLVLPILATQRCELLHCTEPATRIVRWGFEKCQQRRVCADCAALMRAENEGAIRLQYIFWSDAPLRISA